MNVDYKECEWHVQFMKQYLANKEQANLTRPIMQEYEILRVRDLEARRAVKKPVECTGEVSAEHVAKLESALRQKSRQIESQQALLSDLQSQLSLKESEVVDLATRLSMSVAEQAQLQLQLQSTHNLLEAKQLEIVRLTEDIRALRIDDDFIDPIVRSVESISIQHPPRINKHLPKTVAQKIKLESTGCEPTVIVAAGPLGRVLAGTRKVNVVNKVGSSTYSIPGQSDSCSIMSLGVTDESFLAGTSEGGVFLMDYGGRVMKDLKGHGGKVKGCGFLSNKKAFSVATDRTIKMWDLHRGSAIRSVPVSSQITSGASTFDGSIIVSGHQNGNLLIWSQCEKLCEIQQVHSDTCLGIAVSADGRFLVSIGKDNSIAIIDIHMASAGPVHNITGIIFNGTETQPAISPDSKIVSACTKTGIQSWDILLGKHISSVPSDAIALAWSACTDQTDIVQQVITTHADGIVKWWNP